jgi:flagellar hook-associated protein 2
LNEQFKDSGITASYENGEFTITAEGENKLSFSGVSDKIKDLFGIDTSTVVDADNSFTSTVDESKTTSANSVIDSVAGKTITMNYSGLSKKVTISESDITEYLSSDEAVGKSVEENTANAIAYALQKGVDKTFGSGKINVGLSDDNELTFGTVSSTSTLSITAADSAVKTAIGLTTGTSNRVSTTSKAISDIDFATELEEQDEYTMTINDVELTFSKDDTVSTIMSKINNSGAGVTVSYSQTSNSFSFVSNETGSQGRIEITDTSGNLAEAMFGGNIDIHNGTDTVMEVSFDGGNSYQTVTRSSATVNLDGVSITLDKEIADADFSKPISFTSSNDSAKIVDTIKSMIEDYNSLITEINTAVKTRPDSDYSPLTDAQKEEMTESQIEKWEEKAKTGILYGDSELTTLSYELSRAVTNIVSGVGLPSSIGLSLSSSYSDGGVIEIDEDALTKAVEENPDKVISMMTSSSGIMERINTVVQKYAGTTITSSSYSRSRGILVNKAGIENTLSATDNSLYDELTALQDKLSTLETKLSDQQEKLYSKFSTFETFVSQQDTIASWISAQFSS